ncbi:MAG: preprotein translocase subunit SecY [Planctomycetaceae bacterium]|jgi:preprotein translocase subunit SecY|nr:preprotein translocase subunit SecY [Planctomycetaceae bacterium]MBT4012620.1 preprotein translocase subunit SecY [Planctomycetaceae bacterium]MBT4725928.1 preprotein translocase subunit SecY [Planctomycetaceae bacterium]MBT4845710.1 preprotein translocase subunit SecY [Planctomycetaceae bacterium]MBT5126043.1 preprotein translocase subunit SecY [Planctomycetaceae bacterium]
MLEKIRIIFTIPELRNKILITLVLLSVYRIGYHITLPVVDQVKMLAGLDGDQGTLAGLISRVSVFSASNLQQATIFGLGIMPYISASIIFQIMGSFVPSIQALKKEGQSGQKKINDYTRYLTVVLCLVQSTVYVFAYLQSSDFIAADFQNDAGGLTFGWSMISIMIMTCGATFLMWLGEQIDEFGIGNGISLLIMAGILAQMPAALQSMDWKFSLQGLGNDPGIETMILLACIFVLVVLGVVFITVGQRRIPTQSAKHVRGRRVFGGTRQHLPLRVNQGGVMPIIFASSLLMIPGILIGFLKSAFDTGGTGSMIMSGLEDAFQPGSGFLYNMMYIGMIFFFCYFWTAITFNPKEMADNLKEYGSFIQGYRPGKRTADYLEKVMVRITYVGAAFLSVVAIVPTLIASQLQIDMQLASFYGGTGLLIGVSVAFDLVQKIDSHLVMTNYKGLLDS